MPYVTARDGAKLHVRVVGRGQPVVMLHGFAMHSAHWLPYVLPLSRRYRFILPDMRGFGASHGTEHNNDCVLSNYAEDLDDILDAMGLDEVALGGISMGACTSLQYHKLTSFKRVTKYLHIDQSPCTHNGDNWPHGLFGWAQNREFANFQRMLVRAELYGPERSFEDLPEDFRREIRVNFQNFVCYALTRPAHKWLVRGLFSNEKLAGRVIPTDNWYAYVRCMRSYLEREFDMRSDLPRMRKPMTLMVGMQSRMYSAQGQLHIKELVPHARVIRFHRSGHVPFIDEPVKFVRGLKHFLDS